MFYLSAQKSVRVRLDVPKTALYKLLFYYMLNQSEPVVGDISLTRVDGQGGQQTEKVNFLPSAQKPSYYTVGGDDKPTFFFLSKGQWIVELAVPQSNLLLVGRACVLSFSL